MGDPHTPTDENDPIPPDEDGITAGVAGLVVEVPEPPEPDPDPDEDDDA